jgi:hypothetical protein
MKASQGFLPAARSEGIIRKEVDGELLVYDLERNKAHCLNPTAALIWILCNGQTDIPELAISLSKALGTPVDETVIQLALKQLSADHLLAETYDASLAIANGLSRRALVRRLGLAAALLPLITTITAPTASAAGSGCGGACVPDGGAGGCSLGCTCQATGPGTGVCVNV